MLTGLGIVSFLRCFIYLGSAPQCRKYFFGGTVCWISVEQVVSKNNGRMNVSPLNVAGWSCRSETLPLHRIMPMSDLLSVGAERAAKSCGGHRNAGCSYPNVTCCRGVLMGRALYERTIGWSGNLGLRGFHVSGI